MIRERVTVLRREGTTWGLPGEQVRGVVRDGRGVQILLEDGSIAADEILAVHQHLTVAPAPTTVVRRWAVPCRGVAMWNGVPLVVVDGRYIPGFRGEE